MTHATASLADVIARLGLGLESTFVPFSASRNAKPGAKPSDRSLNWKVTLRHNSRDVLTTDYMAGVGHCPCVKRHNYNLARPTVEAVEAITFETENGRAWRSGMMPGLPIVPDVLDVVACLAMDASVLDENTFEAWAESCGYDTDSRKAEAIYRLCLSHALALRNALGEADLAALRDAASEH
jgi:hypothetical protein